MYTKSKIEQLRANEAKHLCLVGKDKRTVPVSSVVKNTPANVGDLGSIPGLGRSDPLEKEMATHSSVLAWKIPRTEELGRLWFMGSQRVR